MAYVKFDKYLRRVAQHTAGCPDGIILLAIRDTAIDFCNRTSAWRDYTDWQTVYENEFNTPLVVPKEAEIAKCLRVYFYGNELSIMTQEQLGRAYSNYPDQFSLNDQTTRKFNKGQPNSCIFLSTGTVNLIPVPDKIYQNSVRAFCMFRPTVDANGMEGDVLNEYYEGIVYGAAERLLLQDEKPWTNDDKAKKFGFLYKNACVRARANINLGNARGRLTVDTKRAGVC